MSDVNKEQELIEQLNSDKRSLRIQAIVKLTRVGSSQAALIALSALATKSDREESFFISQAITKITQKLEKKIESYNPNLTNEVLVEGYNPANTSIEQLDPKNLTTYDFLSAANEKAVILLDYVRNHPKEIPEALLPSVGVFLGKFGNSKDADFIVDYLRTHHNTLTLPYISAAEKIDTKMLIPVLPYLLASKEALVRSRAVMVLQKIDQTEAERHFLRLLASTHPEDRLAALEISFLFPFDRVKSYIVALLPEEKDADVFKACATVLASNPSLELALRILDVLETLPPSQRKPVTSIFNIISVAITTARVLPAKEATPQALVATWKKERLKKFLNDLEIQLCTTTGEKREGIINWLEKNKNIPDVAEFIEHLSVNPQTEDVYQRLTTDNLNDNLILPNIESIFNSADDKKFSVPLKTNKKPDIIQEKKSVETETKASVETNFDDSNSTLPELTEIPESNKNNQIDQKPIDENKSKVQYLKQMDMQQFLTEKSEVTELAENTSTPVPIRVEALNTLLRLSPTIKIKNLGIQALYEDNIKIKTAGFKILEKVAPDVIKDKLSDLLLSSDTNIRVRAIRFGLKVNPEKSIQALEKLISSDDQNHRSYAISCLALCPFESVYKILINALLKEKYDLVAKQITAVLLSNPDPVILTMLDKISVITTDPNLEMVVSQARNELEEILATIPKIKSNLEEIDVFQNPEEIEDKPYSVENVKKLTNKIANENSKKKDKDSAKDSKDYIWWIIIGASILVILIGIIYRIYNPVHTKSPSDYKNNRPSSERGPSRKSNKSSSKIRMNKSCTVTATVTQVFSESKILIKSTDNQEFLVNFKEKAAKGISVGDKVNVTCIPTKSNPNNILLSTGVKLSKISQ